MDWKYLLIRHYFSLQPACMNNDAQGFASVAIDVLSKIDGSGNSFFFLLPVA